MASNVPTFDEWMEKAYPNIKPSVVLIGKAGHRFSYPNKNYREKMNEYTRNREAFEPAISRNTRLYEISLIKINSLHDDLNTVDEMGKYYLNNAFKKLDKANNENEMLKNEIIQLNALFNCRETAHSTVKILEL
jgi:hypothetical protein